MEKILITGGAGFIGSHTTDLLIKDGFKVRILDNFEAQVHGNEKPSYLNPEAELFTGDCTSKEDLLNALKNVDAVIHLAAVTGIGQSMYKPFHYLNTNTVGTSNLYQILIDNPDIRKNLKKIVIASSKTIYGEGTYSCRTHGTVYPDSRTVEQLKRKDWEVHCPICNEYVKPVGTTETKPPQILSVYALSKYDTEEMALMYSKIFEIPTIVFRWFSVYGPRQSLNNPYTGVCSIFINRVKNKNQPIIFEDGKQLRDYVYVEDIARLNLQVIKESINTNIYNVGTGSPVSVLEVAETVIDILDIPVEPSVTENFRAGDNRHDFADISKVKKDLKFKPKHDFKDGIKKLIEWSESEKPVDNFETAESERKKYLGGK
jgi:dTDP-L-rhamnose 4-epimerase